MVSADTPTIKKLPGHVQPDEENLRCMGYLSFFGLSALNAVLIRFEGDVQRTLSSHHLAKARRRHIAADANRHPFCRTRRSRVEKGRLALVALSGGVKA
jgi:hypothetical protein